MTDYLLAIYQPDGPPPPSVDMERVTRNLEEFNRELKEAGAWVFAGALHPASTATVVRPGADMPMTDGPYTEGKEHLGGFTIVRAPDLDAALDWAHRLSAAILHLLPIEVRPFQEEPGG